ncbi:translation initiation factor IF-2-like isoform X2 [Balaenoptera musculus]|uniref:Translation initiation factor IF-2-like isoform X2 n=1 Tax=Balaenoptera musculus TaxID=9771 RepID=A0A8B8YAM0_BALMU|nr:translation initiation factor IF-2-like isoform X2 [Balaenoptera musculus]
MQPRRTAEAGGRWRVLTLCWDHHRALLKLPLLGLLSPQTPFSLTLKLWDAYILESEHMLTAMVYTVRKAPERGVQAAEEAGRPARGPRGRPPERALGSGPAHGSPGHGRPPAKPEEFPTRPLGLERPAPAPRPLLTPPSIKTLPGEDGLALPGPPAQH